MIFAFVLLGHAALFFVRYAIYSLTRINAFMPNLQELKWFAHYCVGCQCGHSLYRYCAGEWEGSLEQKLVVACKQRGIEWLQTVAWKLLYGYGYVAVLAQEWGVWEAWDAVCDWSQRVLAPVVFGPQPDFEAVYVAPKSPLVRVQRRFSDTAEEKESLRAWQRYNPHLCAAVVVHLKTGCVLVGDNAAIALADWIAAADSLPQNRSLLAAAFHPIENPFLAVEVVSRNELLEETRTEIDLGNVDGYNYLFAGNVLDRAVVHYWITGSSSSDVALRQQQQLLRDEIEYTLELLDTNVQPITLKESDCIELLPNATGYRVLRGDGGGETTATAEMPFFSPSPSPPLSSAENEKEEEKAETPAAAAADVADVAAAAPSPEDWLECEAAASGAE